MTIQNWKDSTPRAAQQQREGWWTCRRFQHGYSILCLGTSVPRKTAKSTVGLQKNGSRDIFHARWSSENPGWKLKKQLYGRRKAAKKFNEFVVSATVGLGFKQCPEQPTLIRRPGTTLIFELHQDDFYISGSNVELAWLQENLGAKLKLKPAEPIGPGSQRGYLRATRTRVDADTIHIAPRETYIKNVLDIFGLGDNKCKPLPTPVVQTRQKTDEDEPREGEEDGRAYHRCVGIVRHLLKYRPDMAIAVYEVSKTLASSGDADLRRLRRLGRYQLGTQKLGIMIRKSNHPKHFDAFTDAHWSGFTINRKSTSGGILKIGSATLREFTKGQSCQTLSSGESEYHAAVTTMAEALHLQRFLEFLGMSVKLRLRIDSTAARGIIQRQGCGPLKHIGTRPPWLQGRKVNGNQE